MGRKKKNVSVETNENGHTVISGTVEAFANAMAAMEKHVNGNNSIEIRGAVLDGLFCNYSYNHSVTNDIINKVKINSGVPVHADLTAAFKKLNPHLAVICEEISGGDIDDIENIEEYDPLHFDQLSLEYKVTQFSVSAFSLDGSGDNSSVVLTGKKQLAPGDYMKLETPKRKFEDCQFGTEFSLAIDKVISEVEQYMKGKQAPAYVQPELFEESEN